MRIAYLLGLTGTLALGCVGGQTGEGDGGPPYIPYCSYEDTQPVSVELDEATALGFTPADVVAHVSERESGAAPSLGEGRDGAAPVVGIRFTPGAARFQEGVPEPKGAGPDESCPGVVEVDGSMELEVRAGEWTVKAAFDTTLHANTGVMAQMGAIVPAAQVTGDDVEVGTGEWVDRYEVQIVAAAAGWTGQFVRVVVHVDEGDDPANPFAPSRTERRDAVANWPAEGTCPNRYANPELPPWYSAPLVPVPSDGNVFGVALSDLPRSKSFETSLKRFEYASDGPAPTTVSLDVTARGGTVCLSQTCAIGGPCPWAQTSDLPPTDHVFVGTPVTIRARAESGYWNHDIDTVLWSEVSRRGKVVGHWVDAVEKYDGGESLRAATGIEVDPDGATSIDFSLELSWPPREGGTPAPWGLFVVWGYKSDEDTCTELCSGIAAKQLAGADIGTRPGHRR